MGRKPNPTISEEEISLCKTDTTALLRNTVQRFLERHCMTESFFGIKSVKDHKVVDRLRSGTTVTLQTADQLCAFMRAWEKKYGVARNDNEVEDFVLWRSSILDSIPKPEIEDGPKDKLTPFDPTWPTEIKAHWFSVFAEMHRTTAR
jgi:hypothetical protein